MLPLLKRKSSGEVGEEEALPRRVRSKSPPASPSKQMAVGLSQPEVEGQVPPNLSVAPPEVTGDGTVSDAELGVKLFPNQPPEVAAAMWVEFVTNAKLCIDHYNKKNQVNFVYKHSRGNGLFFVGEQDGSEYYHLNVHAQDKSGHSQLFFGEIEARRTR
ncbi:uncharacterized protein [Miscanthus floridulus]|uniref:uncharacterized protein n=1 Tax=Miscanthus floridulus TaxID=154761 RepID=UPI003458C719